MQDLIVAVILILMVGAAGRYVYKAKKSGARCIGCSAGGCCTQKKGKKQETVTLTPEIEAAFPYIYEIGVEGMSCENCAHHVEQAFYKAGYLCEVDLKARTASVRSKNEVDQEKLGEIVTEAGYVYAGD